MLRNMPPLEAAEAFLIAANARSFRAAAASLALSPSAFSRRIQLLERFVGVALFHRTSSASRLTTAGRSYLAEIGPAIETIRLATIALCGQDGARRVRVATSLSLATEWLVPRLPTLQAEHGIEIELETSRDARLLRDGMVDLGIWGAEGATPGLRSEPLAAMEAAPVSAPAMADGRAPPRTLDELGEHRLLSDRTSRWLWPRWLDAAGYRGPLPRISAHFETNQLCNEAAASGMGIALCMPMVAERFVESGRLVACLPLRLPIGAAYYAHVASGAPARDETVDVLIDWLKREAAASVRRFDRWWDAAPGPLALA